MKKHNVFLTFPQKATQNNNLKKSLYQGR